MKKSIYVITRSHNEYDQYGDYFVSAFSQQPTVEHIKKACECSVIEAEYILKGGGRRGNEDAWYHLTVIKEGDVYIEK